MNRTPPGSPEAGGGATRYRLKVRLTDGDVGSRVVIRWRRPAGDGDEIADVLGFLEAAGAASFAVRKASGEVVTIPRDRALAGKTVPPARAARAAGRVPAPGSHPLPFRITGLPLIPEARHDDGVPRPHRRRPLVIPGG